MWLVRATIENSYISCNVLPLIQDFVWFELKTVQKSQNSNDTFEVSMNSRDFPRNFASNINNFQL